MKVEYFGASDVGLKRTNNEDAFAARPDLGFCTVADGMGGAAAGEIASGIFVATSVEVFADQDDAAGLEERVKRAFTLANTRMLQHVAANPDHAGMGCTAEILAARGGEVVIGHVGDSRTYRLRGGELKQLTVDHSLVQDQVNRGIISAQEARTHAMRHVILRAVGSKDHVELDILRGRCQPGDIFLLCSDGLSDMIDDGMIIRCMAQGLTLQDMTGRLIDAAKAAGGKDNVTVVLARIA
ncbi:MAG TPA: Stp1/IreP family PP2C-type Ser/Thr phosphatase [Deltaproteobacteria bacterium]|nr:Stp1/IreP family PP2C-type Ser/Thr phosphatase [Deltaproteobacteria bacterium]HQI81011.1 Stp1/IreP family PP2C-type Ser/Thr phosphatase [Deltaproteobacteria bacterium]